MRKREGCIDHTEQSCCDTIVGQLGNNGIDKRTWMDGINGADGCDDSFLGDVFLFSWSQGHSSGISTGDRCENDFTHSEGQEGNVSFLQFLLGQKSRELANTEIQNYTVVFNGLDGRLNNVSRRKVVGFHRSIDIGRSDRKMKASLSLGRGRHNGTEPLAWLEKRCQFGEFWSKALCWLVVFLVRRVHGSLVFFKHGRNLGADGGYRNTAHQVICDGQNQVHLVDPHNLTQHLASGDQVFERHVVDGNALFLCLRLGHGRFALLFPLFGWM